MLSSTRPKLLKAHPLRSYTFKNWESEVSGRWDYSNLISDPAWFHGWISFDSLCWDSQGATLYCGLNSLDSDLLYSFDPSTSEFKSLNTRQWADRYDVKIHRTLLQDPGDHCLYFATSLLHDLDNQQEAKGGKLVKYDPASGAFEVISVPAPHLYVQSIAADWERRIIYGFTYPAEAVFRIDLASRRSRLLAYIGNATLFAQPHNSVVDRDGWLWGTCAETRAWDEKPGRQPIRLFKYHPDGDRFVWFDYGLSRRADGRGLLGDPCVAQSAAGVLDETRHKEDFGFCDSMVYDGDRYIYAGTVAGVLCRIDTSAGKVEKLANVISTARFPALAIKDDILYGAGGLNGKVQLIRWDMRTDKLQCFSDLTDTEIGDRPARIHEIAIDNRHTIYLGENDNHHRSSYLWVAHLD